MYDVAIIGGGLVGSSLACALEPLGLRVCLVEARAPSGDERGGPPAFDERNLALAEASIHALTTLGVLGHLATPAAPIRRIHVSRRGDFGAVRLDAGDHGRSAFGAVVVARELGAAFEARLRALSGVERLRPARVVGIEQHDEAIEARVGTDGGVEHIRARLLVAADGTNSSVRDAAGIPTTRHDYGQTLFVCSIAAAVAPDGTAWERFTDTGPIALLPRPDGHFGAIMGVASSEAGAVSALDDRAYLALFQSRFGSRAGRLLRAGRRSAYPITRVLAGSLTAPRIVVMGNAAQTVHPIGAQGFNLGLRDALTLAELLAHTGVHDAGAPALLSRYVEFRGEDRERTLAFSDGLARLTANPGGGMHALRSLGMLALERLPALKSQLAIGAMGYRGRVPALSRPGRGGMP